MLAQLDEVEGVAASRVDWTGRAILLELAPGAAADETSDRACAALGEGARRLDTAAESEAIASWRRGDPWMRSGETLSLSLEESRVLGASLARRAADAAHLDAERESRLAGVLREELAASFSRSHASGGGIDRLQDDWPALLDRAAERSRAFLAPEEVEAARASWSQP